MGIKNRGYGRDEQWRERQRQKQRERKEAEEKTEEKTEEQAGAEPREVPGNQAVEREEVERNEPDKPAQAPNG